MGSRRSPIRAVDRRRPTPRLSPRPAGRSLCAVLVAATLGVGAAGCADDGAGPVETLVDLSGLAPGEVISMRSDGQAIEWIERTAGTVMRLDPGAAPEVVASVDVSVDGEQRGLLGHVVLDGRRFAAWTEPGTDRLVVGELVDGAAPRLVWNGTATQTRSISGHLQMLEGSLLLGIGDLTEWGLAHGSGALVTLDPDGPADQEPLVLSDGWNNPFAFQVLPDGVAVADNAPDGEAERLGFIEWHTIDDPTITELPAPQRAAAALAVLPDGRFGVCGWLDGEMRAYELVTHNQGAASFERAGTVGPCTTAATVRADGSVVVATADAIVVLG